MGVVVLTCPNTGREYSTGIQTDEETFDSLPDVLAHSRCPHCGLQHGWWRREARLAAAIPPSEWVEARERAAAHSKR